MYINSLANEATDIVDVNCYPGHLVPGEEYVNYLVGNTVGLENLIRACKYALENGKYNGYDIGSFIGIRNWETSFFEETH